MANIYHLIGLITKWEGGFVNDPSDPGGATNKGVTITTWKKTGYDKNKDGVIDVDDLELITHQDMLEVVLRPHFWNPWQADRILNQSIANIVVDWAWHSGMGTVMLVQKILGVKADGIVGEQTLNAINTYQNQNELFMKIKMSRSFYIKCICNKRPELRCYKKGWLNRIADFKYIAMLLLCLLTSTLCSCRSISTEPNKLATTSNQVHDWEEKVAVDEKTETNHSDAISGKLLNSDSLQETTILTFSLPMIEDTSNIFLPGIAKGYAMLQRVRKIMYESMGTQSTMIKSEAHQSTINVDQQHATDSLSVIHTSLPPKKERTAHHKNGLVYFIVGLLIIAYLLGKYHQRKPS